MDWNLELGDWSLEIFHALSRRRHHGSSHFFPLFGLLIAGD